MTDREMLELAAKAAGMELKWQEGWNGMPDLASADGRVWNPLADDGDALRLAVRLGESFVVRSRCVTTWSGLQEDFSPYLENDDLRATRRAITRAAAEIGKQMGGGNV